MAAEPPIADPALLAALLAGSEDVSFHTVAGEVAWLSPAAERVLGWTPEPLIGRSLAALWHPHDAAAITCLWQAAADGRRGEGEGRLRDGAGRWRWVRVVAAPFTDAAGRAGVVGWIRDIQREVEAHRGREDAERRFRLAMENAAIGMAIVTPDGAFLEVNAALCRMLGRCEAALRAMRLRDVTHPDDLQQSEELVAEMLAGRCPSFRVRKRYYRGDGALIWGDASVSLLESANPQHRLFIVQIVDMTEVVHVQDELRLLAEHASDVVFRTDAAGIPLWFSQSVHALVGRRPDELVGRPLQEIVHPDSRELLQAKLRALLAGGTAHFEMRILRGDGRTLPVSVDARGIRDEAGRVIGLVGSWRDIQAEMQVRETLAEAHRALLRSEELAQKVMQNSAIGMCLTSPEDGRFLSVNPALCEILGRDAASLVGCSWQAITHPEDLNQDIALFEDVKADLIPSYRLLNRFLRPDGEIVWTDLSVSCIRHEDRSVRYFIAQILDITAQKLASQQILQDRALLTTVLNHIDAHVYMKDRGGRYLYVNHGVETLLGRAADQILGLTDADLFPPDVAKPLIATDEEVFRAGVSVSREEHLPNPEGEDRIFLSEKLVLHRPGEPDCLIGFSRDITELKRIERERKELRSLRERIALDLTRNMPAGTYVLELSLDGGVRFLFVSDRYLAMFRLKREDVLADGALTLQLIHPEDRVGHIELNRRCLATLEPFRWEGRAFLAEGCGWVRIESNPRRLPDGRVIWEGVVTDISSQKHTEQLLQQQKRQLQGINQELLPGAAARPGAALARAEPPAGHPRLPARSAPPAAAPAQ